MDFFNMLKKSYKERKYDRKKLKRTCILSFISVVAIALVAVPISHYIDYMDFTSVRL